MHSITSMLSFSLKYVKTNFIFMPYFFYYVYNITYESNHSLVRYVQFFSKNASKIVAIHASLLICSSAVRNKENHGRSPCTVVKNLQTQEVKRGPC